MSWPRVSAAWPSGVAVRCQPLTKSLDSSDAVLAPLPGLNIMQCRRRAGCKCSSPPRSCLAINSLQLTLAVRDRALGVLGPRAVVGEHVDYQEVGDRGRRFLAGGSDTRGGKRALARLREHRILRIRRPNRGGIVGVQRVGQIAARARQPLLEVFLLQHEGNEGFRCVWIFGEA